MAEQPVEFASGLRIGENNWRDFAQSLAIARQDPQCRQPASSLNIVAGFNRDQHRRILRNRIAPAPPRGLLDRICGETGLVGERLRLCEKPQVFGAHRPTRDQSSGLSRSCIRVLVAKMPSNHWGLTKSAKYLGQTLCNVWRATCLSIKLRSNRDHRDGQHRKIPDRPSHHGASSAALLLTSSRTRNAARHSVACVLSG